MHDNSIYLSSASAIWGEGDNRGEIKEEKPMSARLKRIERARGMELRRRFFVDKSVLVEGARDFPAFFLGQEFF